MLHDYMGVPLYIYCMYTYYWPYTLYVSIPQPRLHIKSMLCTSVSPSQGSGGASKQTRRPLAELCSLSVSLCVPVSRVSSSVVSLSRATTTM